MADSRPAATPGPLHEKMPSWVSLSLRVGGLLVLLYAFLVSISLLGKGFKLFGGGFVEGMITSAAFPLVGLFTGILATTLVQSSSTTTSIVVALVGGGVMPLHTAIPVIMGANIGTSVTNTLVSLGHVARGREFYRAFSASVVHDFFNIFAVLILFPLQWMTNGLERIAVFFTAAFEQVGGFTFSSPLKALTHPAVAALVDLLGHRPWLLVIVALGLMFFALRYLVVTLRSLVLSRVEAFFDNVIFRSAVRAMVFGCVLTIIVQSSSITTSLVVPLAGAGILSLRQIYPYTLGANVGTTFTALLAALAVGSPAALTVAFSHLLFNVLGIAVIWPIPAVRQLPMKMARRFSWLAKRNRWIPVVYIIIFFYLLPLAILWILR